MTTLRRFGIGGLFCVAGLVAAAGPSGAAAQGLPAGAAPDPHHASELGHDRAAPHGAHPHFTHPLVTESPLPEDQIRFDVAYTRASAPGGGRASQAYAQASVEVALTPSLGLEVAVPYVWADVEGGAGSDGIGNVELAVKAADYRFGASGVLLATGLELSLPTGDDAAGTGTDREIGLEPYVGFGYSRHGFEMIGLLRFGVPVHERPADASEVDLELAADLSLLYHLTPHVAAMVELNGAAVVAGESDDTLLTINPGVSFAPAADGRVRVGVGFGVPVTDDADFDYEARTMVVIHL